MGGAQNQRQQTHGLNAAGEPIDGSPALHPIIQLHNESDLHRLHKGIDHPCI